MPQHKRRTHLLFMVIAFACFGVTIEVFFTAFSALAKGTPLCGKSLGALAGISYVWMVFIYGLIPVFGVLLFKRVSHLAFYFRLPIYVLIIYAVEFTSGYLLLLFTGSCPWQYTSGHQVMGLIQLDYIPAWLFFSWLTERIYLFLDNVVIQ